VGPGNHHRGATHNGPKARDKPEDEGLTYQLPFPPPFFLVLFGSSPLLPDLAKYRGRCSSG
jgi:hypothetical protein